MAALDKYVAQLLDTFDIANLLDPDVEKIENTIYQAPLIYKYFPGTRRHFFAKPQLRFSPRDALNDPLEMSVRWKQISTDGLRNYMRDRLEQTVPNLFSNTDLLIEMMREDFATRGIVLSEEQNMQVAQLMKSDAGKVFLERELPIAQALMRTAIDYVFSRIEAEFQNLIDNVISRSGVLSLTEDPMNEQMWAHYASRGSGFVVALDAQHPFFLNKGASGKKHVLHKVIYTDQKTDNFWRNPYYLFLVKGAGWSYEREWRMFKEFSQCDKQVATSGATISLANPPPEIIKAVYFGYGYDASQASHDINSLKRFGSSPYFYRVRVNRAEGVLEPVPMGSP